MRRNMGSGEAKSRRRSAARMSAVDSMGCSTRRTSSTAAVTCSGRREAPGPLQQRQTAGGRRECAEVACGQRTRVCTATDLSGTASSHAGRPCKAAETTGTGNSSHPIPSHLAHRNSTAPRRLAQQYSTARPIPSHPIPAQPSQPVQHCPEQARLGSTVLPDPSHPSPAQPSPAQPTGTAPPPAGVWWWV